MSHRKIRTVAASRLRLLNSVSLRLSAQAHLTGRIDMGEEVVISPPPLRREQKVLDLLGA